MKTKYCLGFMFNADATEVVLMKKEKEGWQKGLYNGLGGSCEEGEYSHRAMQREWLEESGWNEGPASWRHITKLSGSGFEVDVFAYLWPSRMRFKRSSEGRAEWVKLTELPENVIPNLRWLIPLSLDMMREEGGPAQVLAYYH